MGTCQTKLLKLMIIRVQNFFLIIHNKRLKRHHILETCDGLAIKELAHLSKHIYFQLQQIWKEYLHVSV